MALWFDVDDLVRYFSCNARPTGIQRLSLEIFRELNTRAAGGEAIYFCRRQPLPPYFCQFDFPAFDAKLRITIESAAAAGHPSAGQARRKSPLWRAVKSAGLRRLSRAQRQSAYQIRQALRQLATGLRDFVSPASPQEQLFAHNPFNAAPPVAFATGDWLINLGSSWHMPYTQAGLDHLRGCGGSFAVLVYDMIPELFPQWTAKPTLVEFRRWLRETLPEADLLVAISKNTSADIVHCLAKTGQAVPPIALLTLGATIPAIPPAPAPPQSRTTPFVLLVSTFEVRKNHALMFRVWQTLLERHGPAQIPDLVFAGKPGWLTTDLLCQFENAGWLNGKIKFFESPTDSELAGLYRTCLFSVYPSLYEGWGLPVTESLGFGKTVAASNRASIPEAGGDFCVYFDPENIQQAVSVIEDLIRHPERIAALERHIALNYRPPSWADAAESLLNALQPAREPARSASLQLTHQAA